MLAFSSIPQKERIVLSEERFGEKITVETPTTIHSVMEFSNGAIITMISAGMFGVTNKNQWSYMVQKALSKFRIQTVFLEK